MRQQKTGKQNRATYIYYDATGRKVMELVPEENGVTEADIALLHVQDDTECNAQRREQYHTPVHYDAYKTDNDQDASDRNPYLIDTASDPETLCLETISRQEQSESFLAIWNALQPQQRELILKKLRGISNVEIAAEEHVSETAIRHRLQKIQDRFRKLRS